MNFWELERDAAVFVEIWGRIYPATVIRHWENEQAVQLKTEAARQVYAPWTHLSFRWSDGTALACRRYCRLIVPATPQERAQLEHKSKLHACSYSPELGLKGLSPVLPAAFGEEPTPPDDGPPVDAPF